MTETPGTAKERTKQTEADDVRKSPFISNELQVSQALLQTDAPFSLEQKCKLIRLVPVHILPASTGKTLQQEKDARLKLTTSSVWPTKTATTTGTRTKPRRRNSSELPANEDAISRHVSQHFDLGRIENLILDLQEVARERLTRVERQSRASHESSTEVIHQTRHIHAKLELSNGKSVAPVFQEGWKKALNVRIA